MRSITHSALGGVAGGTGAEGSRPDGSSGLEPLLEKLPADEYASARAVLDELLEGGEATIRKLVVLVGEEFGDPAGVKAKYALHGLVHHVSRPNAGGHRGMLASTLAGLLDSNHSDELKAFLCRQLQLCGRTDEVPALAVLLESDRLCEPATQALTAIGGTGAADALRKALKSATGSRRVTLINALGALEDREVAASIRGDAAAEDADLRLVAWYALGNAGDSESADRLLEAAVGPASCERTQATDACLRLARALAEAGKPSQAEDICRRLLSMRKGSDDVQDLCAAMECLASVLEEGAVQDFLEGLNAKDPRLRVPLARIAVDLARGIHEEHPEPAGKLLEKVLAATEEEAVHVEVELIRLRRRGGESARVLPGASGKGGAS